MQKRNLYCYCFFFIVVLTSYDAYEKGILLKFSKLSTHQKDIIKVCCAETPLLGPNQQHNDEESDLVVKSMERLSFAVECDRSERGMPLDVMKALLVSAQTLHNESEVERMDLLRRLIAVEKENYDLRVAERDSLKEKLLRQKAEITDIIKRLNKADYYFGLRVLARKAEEKAMLYVFPSCKEKPYCLSSFQNLLSFLSNPTSNVHTGPLAPEAWREIPCETKVGILKRKLWIDENFGYLRVYIAGLRDDADNIPIYYAEDENSPELAEAIAECQRFLNFDLTNV